MLTCNLLEAGGSKLEAWLTVADFFLSFDPQASCLKLISVLADGLMLVFQHPDSLARGAARPWLSPD
jgi:hypothetical protein